MDGPSVGHPTLGNRVSRTSGRDFPKLSGAKEVPAQVHARAMRTRVRYRLRRLWHDNAGASLLEYTWLIGIIIALVVIGVALAGSWASGMWQNLLSILGS